MKITSLKLTNIRSIETAEFRFQPGFNLIVGVNGVGKSTVLDALCICLSRILPLMSKSRTKVRSFDKRDIRIGFPFLDVDLSLTIGDGEFRYTRRQWKEEFAEDDAENLKQLRREILESVRLRDRALNLLRELEASHGVHDSDSFVPSKADFMVATRHTEVAPNCVFFSTNRSVVSSASTAKSRAAGGKSAAYVEALVPRRMNVAQFADWMRVQEALAQEQGTAKRHLQVLQSAIARFLPTYGNLRPANVVDEKPPHLVINQGRIELDVGQLSDGERGVLALVLDLARRLSQANPSFNDPLSEGHAVVLIDELDLHLHPRWQRQIVHNLKRTFPLCQFIATTHSPQVIGEVHHQYIHIMTDGDVYKPPYSFGVDSSRVLEEILDTAPRTTEVKELLSEVSEVIRAHRFDQARDIVKQLVERLGEEDPEVTRLRTLLDFMEGE